MSSEEKRQHSSQLVPFSFYKCLIPDYFARVPLHWHSEFEINFIISGRAEFICGDDRFISDEGDIIILPPNMLHAVYPFENFRQFYNTIVFSPEMLGVFENDRCTGECIKPLVSAGIKINTRITRGHIYYGEINTTVRNIFSCAAGNTPRLDMLMKSELLRLFWLLWESGDISDANETSVSRSEIIRPAIEYINENFSENITVEKLAQITNLSKSYFMRRFREAAGISVIEYLLQLRIKRACEMLSGTKMTSAEIAFECGFGNLSNFNRQFRKIVGCPPRDYRRSLRNY